MDKNNLIGYNNDMLNLIVAPLSQCEKGEAYCKRVVAFLKENKVEYSVYFSPELNSVRENALELTKEGETDFVVIGDDVVLHAFLNSVENISKIKVGIVPTAGADFASYIGIDSNPVSAIKGIISGNVDAVDYLKVNDQVVINNLVIGASCEIYELYNQQKIKNALTKKILRARYGDSFSGTNLKLSYTEKDKAVEEEKNIFELCIANGGKSKGNKISPLSNVSDGLFNLNYATIEEIEKRGKFLTQFEKGEQIYNEHTQQKWLEEVRLTPTAGKIKTMADGEIALFDELDIKIVPHGLKIMRAKDNF